MHLINMIKGLLILFLLIGISSEISAQHILHNSLISNKEKRETSSSTKDIFLIPPFTYKVDTLSMPDSLYGEHLYVTIRLTAWVNSNSHLLSMHPTSIAFYFKKDPHKPIAIYHDKVEATAKWENIPSFVQRYIDWINKVLPGKIQFFKTNIRPSPGLIILPIKARNYVPVVVYLK